jgi:hypothetical protein
MDTDIGDVEYMHDFFPSVERGNPAGTSYARSYVDLEE